MNSDWEPNIIGFACNWCTYAGADLAGTSRLKYPPNVRLIRIMCTGRLHANFLLKALKDGVDGIFIGGCHPGDCHYQTGNYKARRMIGLVKKVIEQLGFNPERIHVEWISAAEGAQFAEAITQFTEQVRRMGPNPLKKTA